jgi:gag-polyprotein putative aspartyl protease
MMILQSCPKSSRKLLLRAAVFALIGLFSFMRYTEGASSPQAPAHSAGAQVFASADESSPVIESVADGKSLSPIAEMTGAGGLKWFMVKTKSGNIGWIKAGDNVGAARIDEHFRALPKDPMLIGPVNSGADQGSTTTGTGAITVPVKMYRGHIFVPVSFQSGSSTAVAYLVLDTGAAQTMISKRIARDLRLFSIDSQMRAGTTGIAVADVGIVDVIRVGNVGLRNMRVTIHDLPAPIGYDGLLGFDFLGRFQMSIDSDKQVLVLAPRGK